MSTSSPNAVTQPVAYPITVTATGNANNGVATFTWPSIPLSQTWVGTLSCPVAPYYAAMTVFNFADQIGFFRASNAFGPFYIPAGGQLSVTATGLIPGMQYTMFFVGYVSTETEVPPVFPNAYADTVIATNQGGLQQATLDPVPLNGNAMILPQPPTGFAYRIHSIVVFCRSAATAQGYLGLEDGVTGNFFYVSEPIAAGGFVGVYQLLNGQLVPNLINANQTFDANTHTFANVFYDMIEI